MQAACAIRHRRVALSSALSVWVSLQHFQHRPAVSARLNNDQMIRVQPCATPQICWQLWLSAQQSLHGAAAKPRSHPASSRHPCSSARLVRGRRCPDGTVQSLPVRRQNAPRVCDSGLWLWRVKDLEGVVWVAQVDSSAGRPAVSKFRRYPENKVFIRKGHGILACKCFMLKLALLLRLKLVAIQAPACGSSTSDSLARHRSSIRAPHQMRAVVIEHTRIKHQASTSWGNVCGLQVAAFAVWSVGFGI